jgi:hypothetical protein
MPSIGEQLEVRVIHGTVHRCAGTAQAQPHLCGGGCVRSYRVRDPNPELRQDIARLIAHAAELRVPAYLLVNNRAEGSAPLTIAAVAALLARSRTPRT